jgi:hypothetical protein
MHQFFTAIHASVYTMSKFLPREWAFPPLLPLFLRLQKGIYFKLKNTWLPNAVLYTDHLLSSRYQSQALNLRLIASKPAYSLRVCGKWLCLPLIRQSRSDKCIVMPTMDTSTMNKNTVKTKKTYKFSGKFNLHSNHKLLTACQMLQFLSATDQAH